MDLDADLGGILSLCRMHIEVRNRSWMKRVHRDCFIGSDMVNFLVLQGLADSREQAVAIGKKMVTAKMIRHVTHGHSLRDAYLYYRFTEDDMPHACLSSSNAGNGEGTFLGQGGCKWSICPHTAHNSYVLDIALAEELERAVAGASVGARHMAISKLRARVREQAATDAPDWSLTQSTSVNKTLVNVYERKRPRGDFKNIKMTGMVAESPKSFARGIIGFDKRKHWESAFEDGVIVEAIDIGEEQCPIFIDDTDDLNGLRESVAQAVLNPSLLQARAESPAIGTKKRGTDDVMNFLQTVDLAGIPEGMTIAFLNDPERQHALAHLRKQMMLSNPQECMWCGGGFDSSADIRFCPCCAMVSCASCVSKRVFEVASRQVVSVCIHCYRESSRIRHPPAAVKNADGINQHLRGKWWRPEELGMIDHSHNSQIQTTEEEEEEEDTSEDKPARGGVPLIPGLLTSTGETDEVCEAYDAPMSPTAATKASTKTKIPFFSSFLGGKKDKEEPADVNAQPEEHQEVVDRLFTFTGDDDKQEKSSTSKNTAKEMDTKTAICKQCGENIPRDVEAIEKHMDECAMAVGRRTSVFGCAPDISAKTLGGIPRKPELANSAATRIIYRTARPPSKLYNPRDVCAIQDSFVDENGVCYVYEISVRHCDVRGLSGYITAEVLFLCHVSAPVAGSKKTCSVTVISQVDTKTKGPNWLMSMIADDGADIGVTNREDLVRELKASGGLQNILLSEREGENSEESAVNLVDFELLAVLGRGGFGKVMQVKYKTSGQVFAMKILKKTELRRRKQVERTQTERTILANVRHPFIVCMHYAFQNEEKLYMVMDFVQGGDFFTLMRKYKRLPEDWVRVYICEIAMALQHLHDMDVVYRDLKPENILLCKDGHLKLTDFGLSRFFETRPPAAEDMLAEDEVVTRSFCGTEQYMSPEMLLQQGHNWRMDWWCVGLLMHEMISARHPFHGASHYDTLRNMVTKQPLIDQRLSSPAVTIVRALLIKNPKARLCCSKGMNEMKNLPFFSTLDWDAVYNKRIKVPHIPDIADATDISSFESTFTREAAVDSIAEKPKKHGSGGGGIMKMFGFGSEKKASTAGNAATNANEGFEGFSFAKESLFGEESPAAPSSSSSSVSSASTSKPPAPPVAGNA